MDLDAIDSYLFSGDPRVKGEWEKIAHAAHMFSVALFALSSSVHGDELKLSGSGTLVENADNHYVLTAAHVWHLELKKVDKIGITLRENADHTCFIDSQIIVPFGPERSDDWGPWGPDFVLLRIPSVSVGEIQAFKVFYDLGPRQTPSIIREVIQTYLLVGAPNILGSYSQNHANVQFMHFWVGASTLREHDCYTFLDVRATLPSPGRANTFGGLSGGGLWKVQIFSNSKNGDIDSLAVLHGVAFYELDVQNGSGIIRCHELRSILEKLKVTLA